MKKTTNKRPAAPVARVAKWNDPRYRALLCQVLVFVGIMLLGYFLVSNTLHNLERQGIASGFGFLDKTAGFGIGESLIPYQEENTYARAFMVGLLNTILVSVISIALATIIGFLFGIARLSSNYLVKRIAAVYVETLRNIPLLLIIFFWYFAVLRPLPGPRNSLSLGDTIFLNNRGLIYPTPVAEDGFGIVIWTFLVVVAAIFILHRWVRRRRIQTGRRFPLLWTSCALASLPLIAFVASGAPLSWEYPELQGFNFEGGQVISPEFVALVMALSTYTASYIAEIVRAGILAVNKGQSEAAEALGLNPNLVLRLVVIPQALRVIIPPLTNQYLNLTKNSSLAAAIAYPDLVLVFAGTALLQTGQAVEIIAITMSVYLFLSLAISATMNWYNNKMSLVER